jgi:hypothetical protein
MKQATTQAGCEDLGGIMILAFVIINLHLLLSTEDYKPIL